MTVNFIRFGDARLITDRLNEILKIEMEWLKESRLQNLSDDIERTYDLKQDQMALELYNQVKSHQR